jgi:hypothetical protein
MPGPGDWRDNPAASPMLHTFGRPVHIYVLPAYTVLVWNHNLLPGVS